MRIIFDDPETTKLKESWVWRIKLQIWCNGITKSILTKETNNERNMEAYDL